MPQHTSPVSRSHFLQKKGSTRFREHINTTATIAASATNVSPARVHLHVSAVLDDHYQRRKPPSTPAASAVAAALRCRRRSSPASRESVSSSYGQSIHTDPQHHLGEPHRRQSSHPSHDDAHPKDTHLTNRLLGSRSSPASRRSCWSRSTRARSCASADEPAREEAFAAFVADLRVVQEALTASPPARSRARRGARRACRAGRSRR